MGYPPPCQPPLVAAESSSPSFTPKSVFQIVDLLFPRCLLPGGRVSVHLPPKWLVPRVVLIPTPRRQFSSIPGAGLHIPTEVFVLLQLGRPLFKASLESGSDRWRSVSTCFRRSRWRGFRPWRSVSSLAPRRLLPWRGFRLAVTCGRGCPEELLLPHLPAEHSHWYFCDKSQPSLYHTSRRLCG